MHSKITTTTVFAAGMLAFKMSLTLPAVAAGLSWDMPAGLVIQCPYLPADLTEVPTCMGRRATCVGTSGDDVLWGTEDDEVIMAGPGNDIVHADVGDDLVCMGPGNDGVHGGRGDDHLLGEEGTDWLFGARGKDQLDGGDGDGDVLWGGPDMDDLDGGAGVHDICMPQRDDAKVNDKTCEILFPPPGYSHDKQHTVPPGPVDSSIMR